MTKFQRAVIKTVKKTIGKKMRLDHNGAGKHAKLISPCGRTFPIQRGSVKTEDFAIRAAVKQIKLAIAA
jgi:L-asparaginase II